MPENLLHRLSHALSGLYRIEEEMGRGGMATVYRALDLKHDRQVAVKVLHPELVESLGAERFLGEIRTVARLHHPHILPLFDSGEAEGLLYYVMPLVRGETLRARLEREKQLPLDEAIRIAGEVAEALAHAHGEGIIHRDVKPANIMLEGGHAHLADFGVAHALNEAAGHRLTQTGTSLGTPAYMSPEQAAGDPELDGRSDQYALACVLYEMLAGQPPFTGPTTESVIRQHLVAEARSVRQLRRSIPDQVSLGIARALAKTPADRFPGIGDFASAVLAEARASPVRAGRASRLPGLPWGLGAAAVAGLLVVGFLLWTRPGTEGAGGGSLQGQEERVIVIPYQNQTGDPSLDPMGRWVAEWVTEGLARAAGVQVVPNLMVLESLARLGEEGETVPIRRLAEATASGIAVTGTYYRRGEEIELHSEIVNLKTEEPLGVVEPVVGPADGLSEAVDRVRNRVMGVLATRLRSGTAWEVPASVQPPTYEAFQHYARGNEHWIEGRYSEAAARYLQAYRADTTFLRSLLISTAAFIQAGETEMVDSLFGVIQPRRQELAPYDQYRLDYGLAGWQGDLAAQLRAARAGVKLVSGGTLHLALVGALRSDNRPREALENLQSIWKEVQAVFPAWIPLWSLRTELHHLLGQHEEELEMARRGGQLRPQALPILVFQGRALAALGWTEELDQVLDQIMAGPDGSGMQKGPALEELAKELRAHGHGLEAEEVIRGALAWLDQGPVEFRTGPDGLLLRGRFLYLGERWSEAEEVFAQAAAAGKPNAEILGFQGVVAARLGREQRARTILDDLGSLDPSGGLNILWRARIQAILGDLEEAMILLRRAHAEGVGFGLWLHRDMDLENMRGYPPFEEWIQPRG